MKNSMSAHRTENNLRLLLAVFAILLILLGALNTHSLWISLSQVGGAFGAALFGVFAAEFLSKNAEERAGVLASRIQTSGIKNIIAEVVSAGAIPSYQYDPYPHGTVLYLYYVSGNHSESRYWQLAPVTIDFRLASDTWSGTSMLYNDNDEQINYRTEVIRLNDMTVIANTQVVNSDDETSAIFVFQGWTPAKRSFGLLVHEDWTSAKRVDPAVLHTTPIHFPFDVAAPHARTFRFTEKRHIDELDKYFQKYSAKLGAFDAVLTSPTIDSQSRITKTVQNT